MQTTPNLALPYADPARAQKHVTFNEALRRLDAIVQLIVLDRNLTSPPGSPSAGARYIVGPSAAGAWSTKDNQIAAWQDGAWIFLAPSTGWLAWIVDEAALLVWSGSAWISTDATVLNPVTGGLVGINATADATNRLSLNSPASLFSHAGADHQMKINKATSGDTASQLFQTGFSGRAEFGLTGDDDWHVKVSPDGSTWFDAIVVDRTSGRISLGGEVPAVGALTLPSASAIRGVDSVYTTTLDLFGGALSILSSQTATAGFRLLPFGADIFFQNTNAAGNIRFTGAFGGATSGNIVFHTSAGVLPATDNVATLGFSALRWASVWAANGVIQTSDANDKVLVERIGGAAGNFVDRIEPAFFRWKSGGNEMVPSDVEFDVTIEPVFETVEVDEPQFRVDGSVAVETTVRRSVEQPVIDMLPVVDGNGQPVLDARGVQRERAVPRQREVRRPKMVPKSTAGKRLHAGFLAQEVKQAMDAAGIDFGVWGLEDVDDPNSRQWLRPDQLIPLLWAALRETRAEIADLRASLNL